MPLKIALILTMYLQNLVHLGHVHADATTLGLRNPFEPFISSVEGGNKKISAYGRDVSLQTRCSAVRNDGHAVLPRDVHGRDYMFGRRREEDYGSQIGRAHV